jgi:tyrosyl-tRNA synthetase
VRLDRLGGAEVNEAKKILASEVTRLCHGDAAAAQAAETARRTFEDGALAGDLPTVPVTRARLKSGITAYELFSEAKLAESKGEARRLIKGGGARINDLVVKSETQVVTLADADPDGLIKLSAGRKRHVLVRAD